MTTTTTTMTKTTIDWITLSGGAHTIIQLRARQSLDKTFHIDNKDVKFPFDDHCSFLWWSNINLSSVCHGGRTGGLCLLVCDSVTPPCRVKLSVSALLSLPLFANPDTDWQVANRGNVKQGLAKAALSFWSELCLLAAAPIVISRKTLLIIQIQEIKCGWLFYF